MGFAGIEGIFLSSGDSSCAPVWRGPTSNRQHNKLDMNKCPDCGREIEQEATSCECGVDFGKLTNSAPISLREKSLWCAGAWVVSFVALGIVAEFNWERMAYFPTLSPLGILVFLLFSYSDPSGSFGLLSAGLGWSYYVALTGCSLEIKRRRRFFVVYTVLCVSLILNIGGCESLKHASWRM